jgi:RNA polymerase sigma factor (sigma-70 family)
VTSASPSPNDQTLISAYARDKDDQAFRTLVEYYTPLVFGVALRRTGQQQLAEEISQNVFIALARKAGSLSHQQSIGAWLHRAATLESLRALRKDRNRKRHLVMIRDQQEPHDAAGDELWSEIRPLLDELLDRLSAGDRNVLIQHFFVIITSLGCAVEKRKRAQSQASVAQKPPHCGVQSLLALCNIRTSQTTEPTPPVPIECKSLPHRLLAVILQPSERTGVTKLKIVAN